MSGSSDCMRGLHSVAFVTVPSIDVGKTIAHALVTNKLAACVNIVPQITSVYEWEGKVNEDSELLLMIKTRTSLVDKLTSFVRDTHPYTVCEVISFPQPSKDTCAKCDYLVKKQSTIDEGKNAVEHVEHLRNAEIARNSMANDRLRASDETYVFSFDLEKHYHFRFYPHHGLLQEKLIASGNEPYLKWISEVLPEENASDDGKKCEN